LNDLFLFFLNFIWLQVSRDLFLRCLFLADANSCCLKSRPSSGGAAAPCAFRQRCRGRLWQRSTGRRTLPVSAQHAQRKFKPFCRNPPAFPSPAGLICPPKSKWVQTHSYATVHPTSKIHKLYLSKYELKQRIGWGLIPFLQNTSRNAHFDGNALQAHNTMFSYQGYC